MNDLQWDKNFAMEQAADDVDLLQELIDIFKQSCAHDLALIKTGLKMENPSQVREAAHSIKGAAASLGVLSIRDIAMGMETDARAGRLTAAREQISRLEALSRELMSL